MLKKIMDGNSSDMERYEEDDDEEWTSTAMCTEKNSGRCDEEDLQNESKFRSRGPNTNTGHNNKAVSKRQSEKERVLVEEQNV